MIDFNPFSTCRKTFCDCFHILVLTLSYEFNPEAFRPCGENEGFSMVLAVEMVMYDCVVFLKCETWVGRDGGLERAQDSRTNLVGS